MPWKMLKDQKPPYGVEVLVYKYEWGSRAFQIGILQNITQISFLEMRQEDMWFFRGRCDYVADFSVHDTDTFDLWSPAPEAPFFDRESLNQFLKAGKYS